MHHIAIMKKEWGLTAKILSGEKTVETRWYMTRRPPWNRVRPGDVIWFMEAGYVRAKAFAGRVEQFEIRNEQERKALLNRIGTENILPASPAVRHQIEEYTKGKKYCIAVWLERPQKVRPFRISRKGYGAMSAWLVVDDISKLRIPIH